MNGMSVKKKLSSLGLSVDNSVVIGSGILNALSIRESGDVDITVDVEDYERLKATGQFIEKISYGNKILELDDLEIGTSWGVLGKQHFVSDLIEQSVVVDGVRYVTLKFLLDAKKSWLKDVEVRQKDIDDVKLIEKYMDTTR